MVKGQKWLRYRRFSTQNDPFRDYYEVDRSLCKWTVLYAKWTVLYTK